MVGHCTKLNILNICIYLNPIKPYVLEIMILFNHSHNFTNYDGVNAHIILKTFSLTPLCRKYESLVVSNGMSNDAVLVISVHEQRRSTRKRKLG